jgi:hypothetical protein
MQKRKQIDKIYCQLNGNYQIAFNFGRCKERLINK